MRIVNKGKFIRSISIMIFILFVIFNITFAKSEAEYIIEEYQVEEGQTLWGIAYENKSEDEDIRQYIYDIRELNDLKDCNIKVGQILQIKKSI